MVYGHAFHSGWFEAILWAIFWLYTPESAYIWYALRHHDRIEIDTSISRVFDSLFVEIYTHIHQGYLTGDMIARGWENMIYNMIRSFICWYWKQSTSKMYA